MMKPHPDDVAFLDGLDWVCVGKACIICQHVNRPTTEVGHVEQNSGPGFAILLCRECFALRLLYDRAEARDAGTEDAHSPTVPVLI